MDYEHYDKLERTLSHLIIAVVDEKEIMGETYSPQRIEKTIQKLIYAENVAVSDDWEVVKSHREQRDGPHSDLDWWCADSAMYALRKAGFKRSMAKPILEEALERHPTKNTIGERVENAETKSFTDPDELNF